MKLEGSCVCKRVSFSLESPTPFPYRFCYCERCRKINGGTGGLAHIAGDPKTLKVSGTEFLTHFVVTGKPRPDNQPPLEFFYYSCSHCSCHLYGESPSWTQWIYPAAGVIDTVLPVPPEYFHIALSEKPDWVAVPEGPRHVRFDGVPDESIDDWHKRHGLYGV